MEAFQEIKNIGIQGLTGATFGACLNVVTTRFFGQVCTLYSETQTAAINGAASFGGVQIISSLFDRAVANAPYVKKFYSDHLSLKDHKIANVAFNIVVTTIASLAAIVLVPQLAILRTSPEQGGLFVGGNIIATTFGLMVRNATNPSAKKEAADEKKNDEKKTEENKDEKKTNK